MKKVFYNSWIAKKLLLDGYSTITLGPFIFTKYPEDKMNMRVVNHECVHVRQWVEMTVACGVILWLGMMVFGYSAGWLLCSVISFYLWYMLEYLVRRLIGLFRSCENGQKMAYRQVSFEREARLAEKNNNYLENSAYFAWLKLIYNSI